MVVRHANDRPPRAARDGIEVIICEGTAARTVHSCGAVKDQIAPKEVPFEKPPAWNRYRIRCEGDRVVVTFNDKVVIDTASQGRIAGLPAKGAIGLHSPMTYTEFRNAFIRELP